MNMRERAALVLMTVAVVVLAGCAQKSEKRPSPGTDKGAMSRPSPMRRVSPRPTNVNKPHFKWPRGYVQRRVVRLPAARAAQIGRMLGGRILVVSNYYLQKGGSRLQVNVLEVATDEDARRVFRKLRGNSFNGRGRYARRGRLVVELMGGLPLQWHRFMRGLNLLDRELRRYRLTARFGLVDKGNAADINVLFNLALRPKPADAKWKAGWNKLRRAMRFGSTLRLRRAPTAGGKAVYRLTPTPVKSVNVGGQRQLTVTGAKKLHEIPYVDLVAEVPTRGWTPIKTTQPPGTHLLAATPAWPTKDAAVQAVVKKLVQANQSAGARLAALHGWVHRRIRHAGRQGSRDGTLAVLKRGFGRCGDSADVMITLARAAGLPARLVAGWIDGGPGHFWAEVHIGKAGWVSVDATAPWLGVSGDYIPLMISETGPLPLMHLRVPKIERLK